MATIGILLITKNADKTLNKCLSSIQDWADEIVILDSGSTDQTLEIAKRYTQNIHVKTDWEGFGIQRQTAQSYLSADWVFAIDSDEVVTPELKESILNAVKTSDLKTCFSVNRLTWAFGKFIRHSGWYPDRIVRLYPRNHTTYNNSQVHEKVIVPNNTKIIKLNGDLLHYTIDSLTQYTSKTNLYIRSWADQREGKKRSSLGKAISHAFFRFFKMYFIKLGFLDGKHGLLLAVLSANTVFTRYADLWVREISKRNENINL
ncbi:lipopolysaccharide biosynthesis glycosyltransferase [Vibrio ishigakensis]|uniref:Lipopolysaccharide biosynthesis glycosyltransferase n=1 Tax=Vibrio ishigakensis TaxID=1481914 RepID=A0A0B8NKV3_9VIBR|nr:glycosyltransferase family 2 protein [Vibrio ishigakensis]GAM54721.1 lipopolysaccharide biosynthesis glycosyltransferase [Vibrio ishigakensis]